MLVGLAAPFSFVARSAVRGHQSPRIQPMQLQTADGVPPGASLARVRANDRPNAELVAGCVERADIIVAGDLPEA